MPKNITIITDIHPKKNFIHYFALNAADFQKDIASIKEEIEHDGIIWVSWPKKASKIPTDLTENIIRDTAFANGLVDIKVCAVDETWSRLKLVIPVKDRMADAR